MPLLCVPASLGVRCLPTNSVSHAQRPPPLVHLRVLFDWPTMPDLKAKFRAKFTRRQSGLGALSKESSARDP